MQEERVAELRRFIRSASADADHAVDLVTLFVERFRLGSLSRAENRVDHACVYVWPFDQKHGSVFVIQHRKSGLWLAPGGHLEPTETLHDAAGREAAEELGPAPDRRFLPFMLSRTSIANSTQTCRTHYDLWYLMPTAEQAFESCSEEFAEARWLPLATAESLLSEPNHLTAVARLRGRLREHRPLDP